MTAQPAHPLRIVFLGSDPISLPLLDWLADEGRAFATVVAVFTQPDRPMGRGQRVVANAIKSWGLGHGLPVRQPDTLGEDARLELAELNADVALVMAYGHLLRDDFISTPRLGSLNLHASLLPKYRGASPIQTAIAAGERESGVSLMRIVRRLDAGPVADMERIAIQPMDTAADVEAKLAHACVPLLARSLPWLRDGTLVFEPQDEREACFCRKLVKEDGVLDFAAPARNLAARINGLFPWPACSFMIAGQPVKIGQAVASNANASAPPGTVLDSDRESLSVATGKGALRLLRLQRPGGKMLPAGDFLRGFPIAGGTLLPSVPMPLLVGSEPFRRPKAPK